MKKERKRCRSLFLCALHDPRYANIEANKKTVPNDSEENFKEKEDLKVFGSKHQNQNLWDNLR